MGRVARSAALTTPSLELVATPRRSLARPVTTMRAVSGSEAAALPSGVRTRSCARAVPGKAATIKVQAAASVARSRVRKRGHRAVFVRRAGCADLEVIMGGDGVRSGSRGHLRRGAPHDPVLRRGL